MSETVNPQIDFDNWTTEEELLQMVEEYVEIAVDNYNMDVETDWIESYEVMKRAKKTAAKVQCKKKSHWSVGFPVTEEELNESYGFLNENKYKYSTMKVSNKAFEEFDHKECKEVIRHELIHVEQQQRFGTSNHGARFKRKADEYDTDRHCRKFTDYKYKIYCTDCGDMTGGKYRSCKTTKNPELYRSGCCSADIRVEEVEDKQKDDKQSDNEQPDNEQPDNESDYKGEIVFNRIVEDYRFGEKIELLSDYKTESGYLTKKDIKELDWEETHRSWERWANDGDGAWLIDKSSKDSAKQQLENMGWKIVDKMD